MDWTTKLLLAENRTPFIPRSKRAVIWAILDVCAIRFKLGILFHGLIDSTFKLGESPFLGNINLYTKRNKQLQFQIHSNAQRKYLLASGELELGAAKGFDDSGLVLVRRANAHDGLSNVHTCNSTLGFAKGTSHSCLEPKIKRTLIAQETPINQ